MATQIQLRRDTAANWTSNDPTLAEGEIGLETDTKYFKIGDGATAWTSLTYSGRFDSNGNLNMDGNSINNQFSNQDVYYCSSKGNDAQAIQDTLDETSSSRWGKVIVDKIGQPYSIDQTVTIPEKTFLEFREDINITANVGNAFENATHATRDINETGLIIEGNLHVFDASGGTITNSIVDLKGIKKVIARNLWFKNSDKNGIGIASTEQSRIENIFGGEYGSDVGVGENLIAIEAATNPAKYTTVKNVYSYKDEHTIHLAGGKGIHYKNIVSIEAKNYPVNFHCLDPNIGFDPPPGLTDVTLEDFYIKDPANYVYIHTPDTSDKDIKGVTLKNGRIENTNDVEGINVTADEDTVNIEDILFKNISIETPNEALVIRELSGVSDSVQNWKVEDCELTSTGSMTLLVLKGSGKFVDTKIVSEVDDAINLPEGQEFVRCNIHSSGGRPVEPNGPNFILRNCTLNGESIECVRLRDGANKAKLIENEYITTATNDIRINPYGEQVEGTIIEHSGQITVEDNGIRTLDNKRGKGWGDPSTVQDSGTAESGTSNTLTDTDKAWSADQYNGALLEITGGTGSGQIRRITDTTSDTLTVEKDFTTTPDSTSDYRIVNDWYEQGIEGMTVIDTDNNQVHRYLAGSWIRVA